MNPTDTPDIPEPADDVREGDWVDAPQDSHLKSIRLTNRFFARSGPSVLWVTFRSRLIKKTGQMSGEVTYRYESMDHIGLAQIYGKMIVASSPGEILDAELIKKGNTGIRS